MSAEITRETMKGYMQALLAFGDYSRYLAEDVKVSFMGTDRAVSGREAARQLITFIHTQAFKTDVQIKGLVCGDGHAMAEAEFIGTHVGAFEGIPATHRNVRVPYGVAYDLTGGEITELRLYFPLDLLVKQLTGAEELAHQSA